MLFLNRFILFTCKALFNTWKGAIQINFLIVYSKCGQYTLFTVNGATNVNFSSEISVTGLFGRKCCKNSTMLLCSISPTNTYCSL